MNLKSLAKSLSSPDFINLYKESNPTIRASLLEGSPYLDSNTLLSIINLDESSWQTYAKKLDKDSFENLASLFKSKKIEPISSIALVKELIKINPHLALLNILKKLSEYQSLESFKTNNFLATIFVPLKKIINDSLPLVTSQQNKEIAKLLKSTEQELLSVLLTYHNKDWRSNDQPFILSQFKYLSSGIDEMLHSNNKKLPDTLLEFIEFKAFSILWLDDNEAKASLKEIEQISPALSIEVKKVIADLAAPLQSSTEAQKNLKLDWIKSFTSAYKHLSPSKTLSTINMLGLSNTDLALYYTSNEFTVEPFKRTKPVHGFEEGQAKNLISLFFSRLQPIMDKDFSSFALSLYEEGIYPKSFHQHSSVIRSVSTDLLSTLLLTSPPENLARLQSLVNKEDFKSHLKEQLLLWGAPATSIESLIEILGDTSSLESYLGEEEFSNNMKKHSHNFTSELSVSPYVASRENPLKLDIYSPNQLKSLLSVEAAQHQYDNATSSILPISLLLLHHLTPEEEKNYVTSKLSYKSQEIEKYRSLYESIVKPLNLDQAWLEAQVLTLARFYINQYNKNKNDMFLNLELDKFSYDSIINAIVKSQSPDLKAIVSDPKNATTFAKVESVMKEKKKPRQQFSEVPKINRPKI